MRPDDEHQYNSPWNIAARFNMEMSFSADQIARMLQEYEDDQSTGMDIKAMASCIYEYTSGYPYLVSALCKFLDEDIPERSGFADCRTVWTEEGVREAVTILLNENIPLFGSMVRQLDLYPELKDVLKQILYEGQRIAFSPDTKSINIGLMFGFLKENEGQIVIANRIFEMRLMNLFISEESVQSDVFKQGQSDTNQFIRNGWLDMDRVLEKFVELFQDSLQENS